MNSKLTTAQKRKLGALGVSALYLFGSRAEGTATETSDYDYAVLLADSRVLRNSREKMKLYSDLYDFLSDISPRTLKNDVIDIVFLQDGVSLELQAHVIQHGKILFDADPRARADFEERVMIRMADFRPILRIMDDAIIARASL